MSAPHDRPDPGWHPEDLTEYQASQPGASRSPFLTDAERAVVRRLGEVWGDLCAVVGDGPTRDADLAEACAHLHALQHAVMANAAARAYPDEFRALGETIR